jgi:predicted DNA-binding antitoxin AbrB/MazE fold protein
MSLRIKAIYKDGAFVPLTNGEKLNVRENAEVELTISNPYVVPPTANTEEERERALQELLESWRQHPLHGDAPRLTRDELHERR